LIYSGVRKEVNAMKQKLISERDVQLNIEAADWEDALRKAAQPLLQNRRVTTEYVDEVIRVAKTEGPYFVILKSVAMPHANPKCGALENGLALTTLKTPVEFGHENDPVKYIFFLSSANSEEHLNNISRLAELLDNEEFFGILENARSKKEVCDYFNQE